MSTLQKRIYYRLYNDEVYFVTVNHKYHFATLYDKNNKVIVRLTNLSNLNIYHIEKRIKKILFDKIKNKDE